MKDARGYGSDPRGGGVHGVALGNNFQATSQANRMRPDRDFKTDADRTVAALRARMVNTGPGHQATLMQGIKNLLGG